VSVFLDSSALVKLYADEPGHERIGEIGVMVVSQLARVEVPAALWRKQRMGEISADQARVLCQDFEADYFGVGRDEPRLASVVPTVQVLDRAAHLCAVHGLRAYDAVQLGTALAVHDLEPSCATFAAFDDRLRQAAAVEGFSLLPPG
jgi:uncharacterized protein